MSLLNNGQLGNRGALVCHILLTRAALIIVAEYGLSRTAGYFVSKHTSRMASVVPPPTHNSSCS